MKKYTRFYTHKNSAYLMSEPLSIGQNITTLVEPLQVGDSSHPSSDFLLVLKYRW